MKLNIYKKMMLGFGAIITIMILSSGYVLFELKNIADGAKSILASTVRSQELARLLQDTLQDETEYAGKYLVSNDPAYFSLFIETAGQVDHSLNLLFEKQSSFENRLLVHNMKKAHESVVAGMHEKDNKKTDPDEAWEQTRQENIKLLFNSLDLLIRRSHSSIGKEMAGIESIITRSVQVALLLISGTLILAVTAAFIITRTITRPIGQLIKGTGQIARGRFEKVLVSSHDEIALLADAVNEMSTRINDTNKLRTQTMQQISHELRTPLQAMQSALDVLKVSGSVNDSQVKMLDTIKRGIDKVTRFSMQYLDLAKIESGVMQYNMTESDLFKIVKPVVDEATFVAASKGIKIKMESVEVPDIKVDAEKVAIIVSNLITNAVKYTRENGRILVRIGPGGLGVQVTVKDSGIGINPDELPNVFTRFYQASNIKKVESNGSGVGLAIVKAYTEGHGGRIHVESRPDAGSSFIVEFPISGPLDAGSPENSKPS